MSILSLKNQKEFDHVNRHGLKKHGSYFVLVVSKVALRTDLTASNQTIFEMKVSRKFSKKAVIRNKAKRRIRHLVRLLAKNPDIDTKNKAMIIIPKRGFEDCDFAKLYSDFTKAFTFH